MSNGCTVCIFCGDAIPHKRHEHDHAPVPKRHEGNVKAAICKRCHDLKDRTPVSRWPDDLYTQALLDLGDNWVAKILLAKTWAMALDLEQMMGARQ